MATIRLSTNELASRAYMGDRIFINGKRKSYLQIRSMKSKIYTVSVSVDGAINVLSTINYQIKS